MAIVISDITTLDCDFDYARPVFDKSGDIYVVFLDTADKSIRCFKKPSAGGSFSEQDTGDRPSGATKLIQIDARFDGTLIHIAYEDYDGADYDVKYVTFDTSSDQWGAVEEAVADILWPGDGTMHAGISLDSSNKPHIAYVVDLKSAGKLYNYLFYTNKIGASWSAPEQVNEADKVHGHSPAVSHESDNRFVVVWYDSTNGAVVCRTRSSVGAWDTQGTVKSGGRNQSLAIDSDNKKQVVLRVAADTGLYHVEGDAGANPSWSSSSKLDDTDTYGHSIISKPSDVYLYIVYNDSFDQYLVKRENGNWSSPELLLAGTFVDVHATDPTESGGFSYVWRSGVDNKWSWDEYIFAPPPPQKVTQYLAGHDCPAFPHEMDFMADKLPCPLPY